LPIPTIEAYSWTKLQVGLQEQLGISSGAGSCARRPRWWYGNLFKAFYWACVGQPDKLNRKVAEAGQQLGDIQAQDFKTTGMGSAISWYMSFNQAPRLSVKRKEKNTPFGVV